MWDGFLVDLILGLAICAAVLGLIAWFVHYHDPETIDEEEEAAVEHESAEEREQAIRKETERFSQDFDSDLEGFSE